MTAGLSGAWRNNPEYEASGDFGDRETMIADQRYRYIESVTAAALQRGRGTDSQMVSDRIDRIATHKYLAVPLFCWQCS